MKDKLPSKNRRVVILDAAQQLFVNYGLFKVTMDEIAENIGMAKASLYYYFPTKDAVLRAVISREQEEFLTQIKEELRQDISATKKLVRFVEYRLELTEYLINLNRLNHQVWHQVKPIFRDLFDHLAHKELQYLTRVLQVGKNNKEFQFKDAKPTATMILHVLQGLRLRFLQPGNHLPLQMSARVQLQHESLLFINMLIAGIAHKNKIK